MNLPVIIAFLFAAATPPPPVAPAPASDASEPFRLDADDFRWIPIKARQTPLEVECHFEVVKGNPTVHMELLPMSEFRLFDRGEDHDTMAATPNGHTGDFRRIIDTRGQYAVVVKNAHDAQPVSVILRVRTNLNPEADVAQTLSPQRRLTVILISFAAFFVTIAWSGRKLLSSMRRTSSSQPAHSGSARPTGL
jgi:hypothetical protein